MLLPGDRDSRAGPSWTRARAVRWSVECEMLKCGEVNGVWEYVEVGGKLM